MLVHVARFALGHAGYLLVFASFFMLIETV